MTNDIHAAAERWKRFKDGEKLQTIYPDHGMKIESLGGQLLMDQSTVLDFVLSLFDNELITKEFAASVRSSDIMLEQRNDSEWVLWMFNGSHSLLIADVVTKAQVLALRLAMGVKG